MAYRRAGQRRRQTGRRAVALFHRPRQGARGPGRRAAGDLLVRRGPGTLASSLRSSRKDAEIATALVHICLLSDASGKFVDDVILSPSIPQGKLRPQPERRISHSTALVKKVEPAIKIEMAF